MADPEVQIAIGDDDVEMQGDDPNAIDEVPETGVAAEEEAAAAAEEVDKNAPRLTFAESVPVSDGLYCRRRSR